VMVNNSTNINRVNYQLSPLTIEQTKKSHMAMEFQVLVWNRHQNVAVF